MKQFSQLSPASKTLVVGYFCKAMGYQANLVTYDATGTMILTPNPETAAQFVQRSCQEWIVQVALNQRALEASQSGSSDSDLV